MVKNNRKWILSIILLVFLMMLVAGCSLLGIEEEKSGNDEEPVQEVYLIVHLNNGRGSYWLKKGKTIPEVTYDEYFLEGYYWDELYTDKTEIENIYIVWDNATENLHLYLRWRPCTHTERAGVGEIEPTCTQDGYREGTQCVKCGKTWMEEEVIPALGHDFLSIDDKKPTCYEAGYSNYKYCSRCDYYSYTEKEKLEHNMVEVASKDPTCTEVGWNMYQKCSLCDYKETYEEIPAKGHTFEENWIQIKTCTIDGILRKTCTDCETVEEVTYPATGHVPTDWVIEKEETCSENGEKYIGCENCEEILMKQAIPAGHKWGDWIYTATQDCTHDGARYADCTRCEAKKEETLLALGHNIQQHEALAPTCTEEGHEAYENCTRCSYSTKVTLQALGHSAGSWISDKDATCLVGGEHHKDCLRCHVELEREKTKPLGHDIEQYEAKAATCLQSGWYAYECCTRCDEYTTFVKIDALGHDLQHHAGQKESCSEDGWLDYDTCSRCDLNTYQKVNATGHTESGWIIDEVATCVLSGSQHKECTVCKAELQTDTIEALGHDYIDHTEKASTCSAVGWYAYQTCSRCEYTTYEEIAMLEHDLVHHDAKASTCSDVGWNAYDTCENCDYTTYEEVAKLPHTSVPHAGQAVTCTAIGWNAYETCENCDYTTYEEIPALGHDYIDHDAQAVSCLVIGWNAYQTCSRCSYTSYEEISALGHNYQFEIDTEPQCLVAGSKHEECTRCHDQKASVAIPATGHSYGAVTHYNATCVAYAYDEQTCSKCNDVKKAEDTAGGYIAHNYLVGACTMCRHTLLERYEAEFIASKTESTVANPYVIASDDYLTEDEKLLLYTEWIRDQQTNITSDLYVRLATTSFATSEEWYDYMKGILSSNRNATTNISRGYDVGLNVTVFRIDQEEVAEYNTIYPSATPEEGKSYQKIAYAKQDNGIVYNLSVTGSKRRSNDFDDFGYKNRPTTRTVTTSDQLFFAFQSGYQPVPVAESQAERVMNQAKDVLRDIISDDMTEKEKMSQIYRWFIKNIDYDNGALEAEVEDYVSLTLTAYYANGIFDYNTTVCDGISKAIVILAGIEDITCVRATGFVDDEGERVDGHAWVRVYLDGDDDDDKEWYIMDSTWALLELDINSQMSSIPQLSQFLTTEASRIEEGYNVDEYKTFMECECNTEINPYKSFHYGTEEWSESNDFSFATQSELTAYLNYLLAHPEELTCNTDYYSLDIHLEYAETEAEAQSAVSIIVSMLSQYFSHGGYLSPKEVLGFDGYSVTFLLF